MDEKKAGFQDFEMVSRREKLNFKFQIAKLTNLKKKKKEGRRKEERHVKTTVLRRNRGGCAVNYYRRSVP